MFKNIFVVGFCLFNVALFISIGIEVAAVTPEQAMAEGMTQRIYASISYIDYAMASLWGGILVTFLLAKREIFLSVMWLYVGIYLCDIHFGYYMAVEEGAPEWIYTALALVFVQLIFLNWLNSNIKKAQVINVRQSVHSNGVAVEAK
ncbi:hypothetical protein R50073_08770 [Maricurvus nonylphenolicus]|uniref:hypothetical protein n=1 Tax=Maricurvus nonylphenolicus TaxID=1008307 RepID=UPI0036F44650